MDEQSSDTQSSDEQSSDEQGSTIEQGSIEQGRERTMPKRTWLRARAGQARRGLGRLRPGGRARAQVAPVAAERGRDASYLDSHPWFHEEWYRTVTGLSGDRAALVDHYLATPVADRVSPHPLFDPTWFAEHFSGELGERDPFLFFARRKKFRTPFHPLFGIRHYRRTFPEARQHELGPLGHYLEQAPGAAPSTGVGGSAAQGSAVPVVPSAWWPAELGPLDEWLLQRTAAHRARLAASAGPVVRLKDIQRLTAQPAPVATEGVVDVVLAPGADEELLRTALTSLLAQTHDRWHVLVGRRDWGFDVASVLDELLPSGSWTVADLPAGPRPSLDPVVVEAGTGEWIAFLETSDTWAPERLARLLDHARAAGRDVLCDVMERTLASGSTRLVRTGLPAGDPTRNGRLARGRVLVSRAAWTRRALPALRTDLPSGHEFAMNRALAEPAGVEVLAHVGVRRDERVRDASRWVPLPLRPTFDHGAVRAWDDVVLRDRLVDLDAEGARVRDPEVVSVIVPTYLDTHMTLRAVEAVMETTAHLPVRVQVVVVDNGCRPEQAAVLDAMTVRWAEDDARVEVLHNDANLGFALANDVAIPVLRGATTVFLNNDTVVTPGWLEPLLESLEDAEVLGAQSLLRYPDGSVQCAGVVFPVAGGIPYGFGQWHPVEDLAGVGDLRFHAVTAACLAMRTVDVVALGGFDPVFNNGMEDIDLCLRAEQLRRGEGDGEPMRPRFVVRPESTVWHHESVSPGRFRKYRTNRRVFLERWHGQLPADDVDLWAALGFEVVGRQTGGVAGPDRPVAVPRPVLRRSRLQVEESAPRLRWAIKNPAPGGETGERWGDTHFAESLAEALREAGQEVVVDRRPAWERRTGGLDDVALVLRGVGAYQPSPEQVNLAWVISHPDAVAGSEASLYDRMFGASVLWSQEQSRRWGFEVEPLLQATDHRRFHPDLAVPDTGHPVLFVGSSRKESRPLVTAAAEANVLLSVYGTEWRGLIPRRFVKAEYLDNRSVGAAYRAAGVVINDHWEDMRTSGFLSNRLFDATASGARVITDDVAGLGDIFGLSVQVVRSPEDLVRLATLSDPDAVFGDDAERRAVAARIHAEHSFAARSRRLVEVAVEAHRARGFDAHR